MPINLISCFSDCLNQLWDLGGKQKEMNNVKVSIYVLPVETLDFNIQLAYTTYILQY